MDLAATVGLKRIDLPQTGLPRSSHGRIRCCYNQNMGHRTAVVIGIVVMVALIVGLDVSFLRDHFVVRLVTNVCIVAAFAVLYLLLRKHP